MTTDSDSAADLRVNTFSDFVVVSCKATEGGLDLLLFVVWSVARDWLSKGYLSRGGITKGQVIHIGGDDKTSGLVFGPAFIEAYLIEQDVADFPRVLLSKAVRADVKEFKRNGDKTISAIKKLVVRCADGPASIDLFAHLRKTGFKFLGENHADEAEQFRKALTDQMEHSVDVPKWHRKTTWLIECFNEAVKTTAYADKTISVHED